MAQDTRELFIDKAEALFAERGFYGTSIAAIAGELGLTKQALLHHFGSKEKLYGAVLARISETFAFEADRSNSKDPEQALIDYLTTLYAQLNRNTTTTRILMRELLDNKRRAETAGTWYLKPFLERMIGLIKAVPNWQDATEAEAFAVVYQWLGAINYFGISQPTLTGIFGSEMYASVDAAFPDLLEAMIRTTLRARPG